MWCPSVHLFVGVVLGGNGDGGGGVGESVHNKQDLLST